jgi:hypothetical protein
MVIQVLVINVTGKLEEGIDLYNNMHYFKSSENNQYYFTL